MTDHPNTVSTVLPPTLKEALQAIVRSLTNDGQNNDRTLHIDHGELSALVKQARQALSKGEASELAVDINNSIQELCTAHARLLADIAERQRLNFPPPENAWNDAGVILTATVTLEQCKEALAAAEIERLQSLSVEKVSECDMGVGCQETGVCYAAAHNQPERCPVWGDADAQSLIVDWLRKPERRSVPTMDPPWSAAWNACIDHIATAIERGDHRATAIESREGERG